MIKQSSFLKWAQNTKNSVKGSGRKWIHPPDALQKGHVAYLVKYLGFTEVDQAKGIEVVKEAIRKLKFSQQLKQSEGAKMPKVELTISVDGVAVQDPKTKRISHQHPLHRISYCADDKADKKSFSFIAKEADGERHSCYVFCSEKLAEEITLTIGQAFDLAYRKFLETSGRDLEMKKQFMIVQKRIQELEKENRELRRRLGELDGGGAADDRWLENGSQLVTVASTANGTSGGGDVAEPLPPPVPPRRPEPTSSSLDLIDITLPTVGTRLENLAVDDLEDFDPRAPTPPPPSVENGCLNGTASRDPFGAEPFSPMEKVADDPFGMGGFGPGRLGARELENAIGIIDKKLNEMRDGFSRGLSFGKDDFSLEALDPLRKPQA